MPYLFEILLFLLPFGAYALWLRFNPGIEPGSRLVWLALAGIGLGLAGAVVYGLSVSMEPHSVYVPAQLAPDGSVTSHRSEPAR